MSGATCSGGPDRALSPRPGQRAGTVPLPSIHRGGFGVDFIPGPFWVPCIMDGNGARVVGDTSVSNDSELLWTDVANANYGGLIAHDANIAPVGATTIRSRNLLLFGYSFVMGALETAQAGTEAAGGGGTPAVSVDEQDLFESLGLNLTIRPANSVRDHVLSSRNAMIQALAMSTLGQESAAEHEGYSIPNGLKRYSLVRELGFGVALGMEEDSLTVGFPSALAGNYDGPDRGFWVVLQGMVITDDALAQFPVESVDDFANALKRNQGLGGAL